MKRITSILALGAAAVGTLSSTAAHARFMTDSLAGPGDTTTIQSALTVSKTDGRFSGSAPYVTHNHSDWVGNPRWGAGYYVYGYSGTSPGGYSIANNYFSVNARINSQDGFNVLSSQVYATADGAYGTSNVYASLYAGGWQVRNVNRGGAQFNGNYALSDLPNITLFHAKATYSVYAVDVVAEGTVYADAKQTVNGRVWADGISGTLDQSAGVYADFSAYAEVGQGFASGGISVENLSLTSLHFPLASTARWNSFSPAPGACVSIAYAGGQHAVALNWLSGRVVLWGKLFWGAFKDEYEIAKWPGKTESWDLMNYPVASRQVGGTCFVNAGTPPTVP